MEIFQNSFLVIDRPKKAFDPKNQFELEHELNMLDKILNWKNFQQDLQYNVEFPAV